MNITRRAILKASLALAVCGLAPGLARASLAPQGERALRFYNTHTGESLETVYWQRGVYITESLKDINHVLRDHRTGDIFPIEPHLLDLLTVLHRRLDSDKPFEVISGYRSPKSNAMLHATTEGVAPQSLHMSGRAIDIRLTDRPLTAVRDVAIELQGGGVGYYPASDFVHVDTGDVRTW